MSPYPAQDYYADMKRRELQTQIDRTKTGLMLLVIGLIIYPLPYVGAIGALLNLIGAIMVILGRKGFGPVHARNTIVSLILYVVGGIAIGIGGAVVGFSLAFSSINGTIDQASVANAVQINLISMVAAAVIDGIAIVLFTYTIQKEIGRILLWVGYAVSVAISVVTWIYVSSILISTVASAFSSGTYNSALVQDQISAFQVLGVIPGIIFAIPFYMARDRIVRGEIPMPQQPYNPTPMPPTAY